MRRLSRSLAMTAPIANSLLDLPFGTLPLTATSLLGRVDDNMPPMRLASEAMTNLSEYTFSTPSDHAVTFADELECMQSSNSIQVEVRAATTSHVHRKASPDDLTPGLFGRSVAQSSCEQIDQHGKTASCKTC